MNCNSKRTEDELISWLERHEFEEAEFESGKCHVSTLWMERFVYFKLLERPGFGTFYKEAFGGSILVFECKMSKGAIEFHGYAPLWIFGFWMKKLEFKEKASLPFKYLEEGHELQKKWLEFITR